MWYIITKFRRENERESCSAKRDKKTAQHITLKYQKIYRNYYNRKKKKRKGKETWRYRNKARSCTNSYAVPSPPLSPSPHFKACRRPRAKTHFTTSGNDTLCALRDREEIKRISFSVLKDSFHVPHVQFSQGIPYYVGLHCILLSHFRISLSLRNAVA